MSFGPSAYVGKDVRICGYFSKSKGVCQQKCLEETVLEDMTWKWHALYDVLNFILFMIKEVVFYYKFSLVLTAFIEMPELLQNMQHNYKFWKEKEKSGIHRIQDVVLMQQQMKACEKTD